MYFLSKQHILLNLLFLLCLECASCPSCLLRKTFLELLRQGQVPMADILVALLVAILSPLP